MNKMSILRPPQKVPANEIKHVEAGLKRPSMIRPRITEYGVKMVFVVIQKHKSQK